MTVTASFADWDDAQLVEAARGPQPQAFGDLFERWYDRCFDVAWGICRDREAAADVAQETFCSCWERLDTLREPAAFGGWILRATRNHALNRLERERIRRHDSIDAEEPMAIPDPGAGPDARVEQEESRRLVWTAASVLGDRDTSLLDLHLRHGLGPAEIADELSITANNASQLLHRLRVQMRDTIGAVLLWRRGRPECHALARLVEARGEFDAELSAVIRRHRRACPQCTVEVQARQPELLFASLPVAIAAAVFKDQARAALVQAGVPMPGFVPAPAPAPAADPGASAAAPPADCGGAAAAPPVDGGAAAGASHATSGTAGSAPAAGGSSPAVAGKALAGKAAAGKALAGKALVPTLVGGVVVAGILGLFGSGLVPRSSPPNAARDDRPAATASAPARAVPTLDVSLVSGPDASTPSAGAPSAGAPSASPPATVPAAAAAGAAAGVRPSRAAAPGRSGSASAGKGTKGTKGSSGSSAGRAPRQGSGEGSSAGGRGGSSPCQAGWLLRVVRYPGGREVVVIVGGCPARPWWWRPVPRHHWP